ncbi:hypothetical protein I3760_09G090300 [Carya illinoinensis]|nr:hypothetical protein I3760_09G090300 [Carya illinoinensis]
MCRYWDINWGLPGGQDRYQLLRGAEYSVIHMSNDHLVVSFKSTYDPSTPGTKLPLSVDTRYILKSGVSGFHRCAIYERPPGGQAFDLAQTRMVFKLRREEFHYMAISDEKQRIMPMPEDLLPGRGKQLIVPESVLLINPINPDLKGEVDDKYQYSMDNKDGGVHGWISSGPINVGFWVIFPSHEFRNGGPTKQNLTVHTDPACLAMFHGTHFIGDDILAHFQRGETWRKVFGTFFIYLNSTSKVSNAYNLWTDANKQRLREEMAWPYDFVSSPYYLNAKERGSASGRLLVEDRYVSNSLIPAKYAYVGLSVASTEGAWQTESKDYQFWVQTDSNGSFIIKNVIPGIYGLHGWVPGFIGDYFDKAHATISAGSQTQLGNLTFVPLRDGPTVWEIGFPDRTATGYFVPDVNPMYVNKLFLNSPEKFRQYDMWDRCTDTHPEFDQVLTIGISDPKRDWFFAHVDRLSITWKIQFNLDSLTSGIYKLRLAIASATRTDLQAHVNNMDEEQLVFQIMNLGTDNTACRNGIHGLYRLEITTFLALARGGDALCGILYDYLGLEGPAASERSEGLNQ